MVIYSLVNGKEIDSWEIQYRMHTHNFMVNSSWFLLFFIYSYSRLALRTLRGGRGGGNSNRKFLEPIGNAATACLRVRLYMCINAGGSRARGHTFRSSYGGCVSANHFQQFRTPRIYIHTLYLHECICMYIYKCILYIHTG